jgi:peptidoglycan hydrolase-like protein with peptidoglycan-binding domain
MVLRVGDKGEPVKMLQRHLNKLGSLLLVDGDFGASTRDAIPDARTALAMPGGPDADDALQQALAAFPDPCPPLTCAGVTFIARFEVGSPAEYRRQYCHPTWPSATSGITIGIGYDLRFSDAARFRSDWSDRLPDACTARLLAVLGSVGSQMHLDTVRDLTIPLPVAVATFVSRSLPHYLDLTRRSYPTFDALSPSQRTALVSLVYNRGSALADRDPVREDRREMRAIHDLLAAGDLDAVPAQFESMTRLYDPAKLSGLITRRQTEATLWRAGFSAVTLG